MVLDSPFTGCRNLIVVATSDNADVTVSPNFRTFNNNAGSGQNWNNPQTFTVTAAQDTDNTHDTATVTVALANTTFSSGITAASFEPVTDIPNVSVSQVSSVSSGDTSAVLTLAFTGDFTAVETRWP